VIGKARFMGSMQVLTEALYSKVGASQYIPTQLFFGPAMHPCPSRRGTAKKVSGSIKIDEKVTRERTSIEAATDRCHGNLKSKKGTHGIENSPVLVIYSMYPNNMDG
jgi:hypothetical protein